MMGVGMGSLGASYPAQSSSAEANAALEAALSGTAFGAGGMGLPGQVSNLTFQRSRAPIPLRQ